MFTSVSHLLRSILHCAPRVYTDALGSELQTCFKLLKRYVLAVPIPTTDVTLISHNLLVSIMQAQGVSLRSPDVLTPSQKKRDAEEEDIEVSTHTSWGGRGKRGAVPATAAETPNKRRRVQVREGRCCSLFPACHAKLTSCHICL